MTIPYVEPGSPGWSDYIQQGLAEAFENARAMHIREGRGDMILAMEKRAAEREKEKYGNTQHEIQPQNQT